MDSGLQSLVKNHLMLREEGRREGRKREKGGKGEV
jgi:hypothetical protein